MLFSKGKQIKLGNESGLLFLVFSILFYFVLKLPFNLSVVCSSVNEGFYFVYGQHFINGSLHFPYVPFLIFFYSLILKIFGFSTWSIIAIHFCQTILVIFIQVLVYLLVIKLSNSTLCAGICVFLWTLLQCTPIGHWASELEIKSHLALEAEFFCVLLWISSMYLLVLSANSNLQWRRCLFSFLAGILAAGSFGFKASGAVLMIAVACWALYLMFFRRNLFQQIKPILACFYFGTLVLVIFFSLFIYICYGESIQLFKDYFLIGSYSTEPFRSKESFLIQMLFFMMRGSFTFDNFILFILFFVFIVWSLIRSGFVKEGESQLRLFFPLLGIWGLGSACAVIAPGFYGSYYYILVWPSLIMLFVLGLKDFFLYSKVFSNLIVKVLFIGLIVTFFAFRVLEVLPAYYKLLKEQLGFNLFFQPQSFQDPVIPSNFKRPDQLGIADLINIYIPNKNDTVYSLNFVKGHYALSPELYVYAKRLSSTSILSDVLTYPGLFSRWIDLLIDDLSSRPPKVFVVPRSIYYDDSKAGKKELARFMYWLNSFLNKNYHLEATFNFKNYVSNEVQFYDMFQRNS